MNQRILRTIDLRWKKRGVKSVETKGVGDLVRGDTASEVAGENFGGAIEATGAVQKQDQMVGGDTIELRIVVRIIGVAGLEMQQRGVVVGDFEFREAEKSLRAWSAGGEREDLLESRDGVVELVGIVEKDAEVPPTLGPIGAEFQCATVERDRVGWMARVAGRCGCFREGVEVGRGILLRWCCRN